MKPLKSFWLLIFLAFSLCCQQDKAIKPGDRCKDGTCCGEPDYVYKLIRVLENEPADYANLGFRFGDTLVDNRTSFLTCLNSWSKVENLKPSFNPAQPSQSPPKYAYRVWGKLYQDLTTAGFYPTPIYDLYIEKVELAP
jgi:hypothetical protein